MRRSVRAQRTHQKTVQRAGLGAMASIDLCAHNYFVDHTGCNNINASRYFLFLMREAISFSLATDLSIGFDIHFGGSGQNCNTL